jgi:EpsI family protein
MRKTALTWAPAAVLALGALFVVGIDTQRSMELRAPLSAAIPDTLLGFPGKDIEISEAERRVSGVTDYLMRTYEDPAAVDSAWFSVYVGYYDRQLRGKTIHSPKNCLPGSGWEALQSRTEVIETRDGPVRVNRYLLRNGGGQLALVLYWYQGRGRVEANEFLVKWDLLRDAALRKRTDEALVRIVTPVVDGDESAALARVVPVAESLIPALRQSLPD